MAGVKIKDAVPVVTLKDTDKLPISDGSNTAKSVSVGLIKSELISETITSELYVKPKS